MAVLAVFVGVISLGAHPELPTLPPPVFTFPLTVGTEKFELQEVDVGSKYGCPPGTQVGVVLRDARGLASWFFNVNDTVEYLTVHGCWLAGTSAASVVGVAVPDNNTALWVIQVLACGASCHGLFVFVFEFHPSWMQFAPHPSEYGDVAVSQVIYHDVGRGGVKFAFPRLVFYVNNGYKECPSHFTRMIYEWTLLDNFEQFILTNAVAYTSHQCDTWTPDPGE